MANSSHCMHFVERKKRFCRMTVREGRRYCGEHQQDVANSDAEDERVPCPLDSTQQVFVRIEIAMHFKRELIVSRVQLATFPSSTCYRSKLMRHLRVCNVKRKLDARPAFVIEGVNLDDETIAAPSRMPLSQLDASVVDVVIRKIHAAYGTIESFGISQLKNAFHFYVSLSCLV